jgi:Cu+-exporting ATPase
VLASGVLYYALGIKLNPMIGSLTMSISSVFVVLNALRINMFKGNNLINEKEDKGMDASEKKIYDSVMSREPSKLFKGMNVKEAKELEAIYKATITKYKVAELKQQELTSEDRYEYVQTQALAKQIKAYIHELNTQQNGQVRN